MNDRELLELAAKAAKSAGMVLLWAHQESEPEPYWMHDFEKWDPLTSDGDALRLAVKLQIQVAPGTYNKDEFSAYSSAGTQAKEYWSTQQSELEATRRAIVRAAAEIGRGI